MFFSVKILRDASLNPGYCSIRGGAKMNMIILIRSILASSFCEYKFETDQTEICSVLTVWNVETIFLETNIFENL